CESGVYSEEWFDFSNGGVIEGEVFLQMDHTNGCWVDQVVGFTRGEPYSNSSYDSVQRSSLFAFRLIGEACWASAEEEIGHTWLSGYGIPRQNADHLVNQWVPFSILVKPDGWVDLSVNGKFVARSDKAIPLEEREHVRIFLGGRSSDYGGRVFVDWLDVSFSEPSQQGGAYPYAIEWDCAQAIAAISTERLPGTMVSDGVFTWEKTLRYSGSSNNSYRLDSDQVSFQVTLDTRQKKLVAEFADALSFKLFLAWGANQRTVDAPDLFIAQMGRMIADETKSGAIRLQDHDLMDRYSLFWYAKYSDRIPVRVVNQTEETWTIVHAEIFGNRLWLHPEDQVNYPATFLPVARRWSPYPDFEPDGVVRNSGQGTLGFDLDIRSPNPVFVMAIAANDNGESSSISLNGQPFVSRSGCCASYRQTSL
ncbi:MAG TPA: hypothetical protein PLF96_14350, partial [Thermotogota bacterium]|nr:hypothetical protein [Thermotogota bacterium]